MKLGVELIIIIMIVSCETLLTEYSEYSDANYDNINQGWREFNLKLRGQSLEPSNMSTCSLYKDTTLERPIEHRSCALQCWKCIAHDCQTDPEDNYKALKVKCDEGQRCMKVRYRMFDNITHYDSVIRTCTDKACEQSSQEDFYSCLATPTKYMIGGCTLRSCCEDRDLCNISGSVHLIPYVTLTLLYLLTRCFQDRME